MMAAALAIAAASPDDLPIRALLSTGEQNLRARAERMAIRLSGSDQIASCQVTAEDAKLTAEGRWRFPSRQLRLVHQSLSPTAWALKLREELPAVAAGVGDETLSIDLRWIAAADDNPLARLVGGESEVEAE